MGLSALGPSFPTSSPRNSQQPLHTSSLFSPMTRLLLGICPGERRGTGYPVSFYQSRQGRNLGVQLLPVPRAGLGLQLTQLGCVCTGLGFGEVDSRLALLCSGVFPRMPTSTRNPLLAARGTEEGSRWC